MRILDPASGDGNLLEPIIKNNSDKIIEIDAYDIDNNALLKLQQRFKNCNVKINIFNEDFLLSDNKKEYDLIISNPPYVRSEIMNEEYREKLKNIFNLNSISYSKSSSSLREYIKINGLNKIVDFNDINIFDNAQVQSLIFKCIKNYNDTIKYIKLSLEEYGDDLWNRLIKFDYKSQLLNKNSDIWTSNTADNGVKVGDIFNVQVGLKTHADKIFIKTKEEWEKLNITKHLYPIYMKNNTYNYILYDNELTDENNRNYILSHDRQLLNRKGFDNLFFKISQKQYNDYHNIKIIFKDISIKPEFKVISEPCFISGNCYYMTLKNDINNLDKIIEYLNSDEVLKYYDDNIGIKMTNGCRRFMAQYVKMLPFIN